MNAPERGEWPMTPNDPTVVGNKHLRPHKTNRHGNGHGHGHGDGHADDHGHILLVVHNNSQEGIMVAA